MSNDETDISNVAVEKKNGSVTLEGDMRLERRYGVKGATEVI